MPWDDRRIGPPSPEVPILRLLVPLALIAVLLASCSSAAEGTWVLTSYLRAGESIDLVEDLTLDVAGSEIAGFSGCNSYFGTIAEDGDIVTFTEVGNTEAWCEETGVMALEAMYLNDLVSFTWNTRVEGKTLVLNASDTDGPSIAVPTELTFEEQT